MSVTLLCPISRATISVQYLSTLQSSLVSLYVIEPSFKVEKATVSVLMVQSPSVTFHTNFMSGNFACRISICSLVRLESHKSTCFNEGSFDNDAISESVPSKVIPLKSSSSSVLFTTLLPIVTSYSVVVSSDVTGIVVTASDDAVVFAVKPVSSFLSNLLSLSSTIIASVTITKKNNIINVKQM